MRTITNLTLAFALALASVAPAASQTFEVLANFKPDVGMPQANLLHASDGYLYGTTWAGGEYGLGSVFRMRPNGTGFETVHSFSRSDGAYPTGELIEFAGALYGMTEKAGTSLNLRSHLPHRAGKPIAAGGLAHVQQRGHHERRATPPVGCSRSMARSTA